MSNVREADVAGFFYPSEKEKLQNMIESYFVNFSKSNLVQSKIVIAPHAGYKFSGNIAALSHFFLQKSDIIAIFAPAHNFYFKGIASHSASEFETPLGNLPCDLELRDLLVRKFDVIQNIDQAFEKEHGLETHLPFIKYLYGRQKILPFIIGDCLIDQIKDLISFLYKKEVSIVISSDMSHFLNEKEQQLKDSNTINKIKNLDYNNLAQDSMCGFFAVRALLKFASENNLKIKNIATANSAKISGDKDRVVGYASFLLS